MKVYLGLGTNLGDRRDNLEKAIEALAQSPSVQLLERAGLYESAPVGPDQPRFMNTAVAVETSLDFLALLKLCKSIEVTVGRTPTFRWGPRVIDIDLLASDAGCFESEILHVPHVELSHRRFALAPLSELAPNLIPQHAEGALTVAQLLKKVLDQDVVRLCPP